MNNTILTHSNPLSPPFKFLPKPKFNSTNYPNSHPKSHFFPTKTLSTNSGSSVQMSSQPEPETDNLNNNKNNEDGLVIEASVTKTLPPALNLHYGVQALKDALLEFQLNLPSSPSGFVRFQVAVPSTVSALNWFCNHPSSSSGVFPQFYISKQSEKPENESAYPSESHGVFGSGAAVSFRQSSSTSDHWNTFRRYLLVESLNVSAYGFIGINSMYEPASFYLIIPQIELNEYESFSMLTGTLVWGGSTQLTLEQALISYERSLFQAADHIPSMPETFCGLIGSATQYFNVVKDDELEMVYMDAPTLGACDNVDALEEMESTSISCDFCVRLSPVNALCSNTDSAPNTLSQDSGPGESSNSQGKNKGKGSNVECHHSHKIGHWRRNCPKYKEDIKAGLVTPVGPKGHQASS